MQRLMALCSSAPKYVVKSCSFKSTPTPSVRIFHKALDARYEKINRFRDVMENVLNIATIFLGLGTLVGCGQAPSQAEIRLNEGAIAILIPPALRAFDPVPQGIKQHLIPPSTLD
jgi:hypothetical protein